MLSKGLALGDGLYQMTPKNYIYSMRCGVKGSQLFNNAEIDGDDLHRILLAIANLFEYLNTKYGEDEKLNEEGA
ncbi:MAG TPA: hypothetical protein VIM70_20345 [Clostridium sp.]